jgi:hypothetical protein
MGRRIPTTPFEQFCMRLARTCLGSVRVEPSNPRSVEWPQAWLKAARQEDIAHARALCQEYRVALRLGGDPHPTARAQATLWVSPQTDGATFALVDAQAGIWKADAGCTLAQLAETGVFSGMALPPELTLAQWFAWPESVAPDAVRLIECAEVLLADGTVEVLGPFGATSQTPLRSPTVQRLVPKLFELVGSDAAQRCAQVTPWAAGYRLDALIVTAAHDANLAQLFFGHRGRLGWIQTLWLRRPAAVSDGQYSAQETRLDSVRDILQDRALIRQSESESAAKTEAERATLQRLSSQLDQELKHILDPLGVFGSNSDLKGLESAY